MSTASSQPRNATTLDGSESNVQQMLQVMRTRIHQLEQDKSQLLRALDSKAEELHNKTQLFEAYKVQAKDVVKQWSDSTNEARRCHQEAEAQVTQLSGKVTSLKAANEELTQLHLRASLETSQAVEARNQLAAELAQLRTQQASLEAASLQQASDLASKQQQFTQRFDAEMRVKDQAIRQLQEDLKDTAAREEDVKRCLEDAMELARGYKAQVEHLQHTSRAASETRNDEWTLLQHKCASAEADAAQYRSLAEEREVLRLDAEARLSCLDTQLCVARDDCERLREELQNSDQAAERLVEELRVASQSLAAAQEARNAEAKTLADVQTELHESRAAVAQLRSERDALESDVVELQDTIASMKRVTVELEHALHESSLRARQSEVDQVAAEEHLRLLRDELVALKHQHASSCAAAAEQIELFVQLQQTHDANVVKLGETESQLRGLQTDNDDTANKLVALQQRYLSDALASDALRAELATKTAALEDCEAAHQALTVELSAVSDALANAESHVADLQTAVDDLRSQVASQAEMHKAETHVLRCELQSVEASLTTSNACHAETTSLLQNAAADRDLYLSELGAARRNQQDLETFINTKIDMLTSEAQQASEERDDLQRSLVAAKLHSEGLQRKLDAARDEQNRLRALVRQAQETGLESNAEVDRIVQKVKALQAQLAAAEQVSCTQSAEIDKLNRDIRQSEIQAQQSEALTTKLTEQVKGLEVELAAAAHEQQKLNDRMAKMKKAFEERSERDRQSLEAYIAQQSSEREVLVNRYNTLHDAYKDLKTQCRELTQKGSAVNVTVSQDASSATQLIEATTRLKHLLEVCQKQEDELVELRRDTAIYHKVLEGQLERADVVDVERVLRDRSVTVHQLNLSEGPRRQPRRRQPSTLLGPLTMSHGSSQSQPREDLNTSSSHIPSAASRHSASMPLRRPHHHTVASNDSAPHHEKVARRSSATPFEEHTVNTTTTARPMF